MRYSTTCALLLVAATTASAEDKVDFDRDIRPLLQSYCVGCHTSDEPEGGLDLESHAKLISGGDSGLALTPGETSSSRMLLMLTGKLEPVMPPEGEERPGEQEIELLTTWIEQGALGPKGDLPIKRQMRTPKIAAKEGIRLPVTAIALSADGRLRAVARYGSIEVLREDGSQVVTISEELNKVNSVQFSQDGTRLLVASGVTGVYGNAAIFSTESGELLREMVGHRDVLYAAEFSPDELLVATAGYDREIILWDAETGEPIRSFQGHNGAIFDLAFSPDGKVLVSACADETAKVWSVETGQRLDTLSQPEGEVFAVDVTRDGKFILAGSADNRLRVWSLRSKVKRRINPIVATRFVDESPLVNFELAPDGKSLVVLSEAGNIKLIRTADWRQVATLEPLGETGSDLSFGPDSKMVAVSLMNGEVTYRDLPPIEVNRENTPIAIKPIYMDLGEVAKVDEAKARADIAASPSIAQQMSEGAMPVTVPRGVEISGLVSQAGESDQYSWASHEGEVWAIDADAVGKSPIDPTVTILDANQQPVLRTRLQAIRDSYFTFRGKDSNQIGDFRIFNWQEMRLNDFLYAAGEVTRLWMYPRGPDSGYNVYPNEGNRWTYFGTSHTTHALGEPAYIVRPLTAGRSAVANGLPVFDVYYQNDDDPMRLAGKNSRLLFTAPSDGTFSVRITDTRGSGGDDFAYRLVIRAAAPRFKSSVGRAGGTIRRGSGREFTVRVDRIDGFDGPVTFDIHDLPPGVVANVPLTIEAGQRYAVGTLWAAENAEGWEGKISPEIVAHAMVLGRRVERRVGTVGDLTLGDPPSLIPSIQPTDRTVAENEDWTLTVRRGETVSARVVGRRKEGFTKEVSFGKENSGRNTTHGVYVDNIGLNGLLVREGENEREFFLTADPIAVPGKRSFFLTGEVDGKVTTHPITVEVLP
jgi:WD40 repeat protein